MKQFCVSSNCTACGECLLQTNLLEEDATGHAVPALDRYISDTEMAVAEEIVASCPAHALSIKEKATASLEPDAMIASLKERLENIDIPSTPNCKITFDENDYSVDYGFISGEGSFDYSSESRALSTGRSRFRETFWNRRKDFALSYLAQYKSKLLRPFYDFANPDKTYFSQFSKQFSSILKEAKAELSAISGDSSILPENFVAFNPEMDHDMQTSFAMERLQDIDSVSYVNEFFEGFEKDNFHCLKYYENRICSDEFVQIIGTDWLGNDKIKTTYSFYDANSTGKELVDDIALCLSCAGSYGVRYIDDIAEDNVKSLIEMYRELAKKTIQQKISVYTTAVKAMTQADRKANKPKAFIGTMPKQLTDINYSPMQTPKLCSETERQKKILQLCIEGWNILYSTQNYLVYHKYSSFFSSSKEVFCLNLRTLEVTTIPNPDELRCGPSPIIIGDRIIYDQNGHIYAYDVEHLQREELMTYTGRVFKLCASDDYVMVKQDNCSYEGIRYLSLKNYSSGVFKYPDGLPYDCLARKNLYRVNTNGFCASGKGRLESYDLDERLGTAFGVVPSDFEPFAERGTQIYGMVNRIINERTLYVYDTAADKLTKAFHYNRDSRMEDKFDKGGNLRIFAGESGSENYNVYCLNLETGEISRLMSVKANIELVARFESTLYYMETRSKQTRFYAMELVGTNHSPVEIGLVFGSNSKE